MLEVTVNNASELMKAYDVFAEAAHEFSLRFGKKSQDGYATMIFENEEAIVTIRCFKWHETLNIRRLCHFGSNSDSKPRCGLEINFCLAFMDATCRANAFSEIE